MTESSEPVVSKDLFNARFDALNARLDTIIANLEKENNRQDEAIERLADRTTPLSETRRLIERVERMENTTEALRNNQSDLSFKMKITWAGLAAVLGGAFTIIIAYIKYMLGI